MVMTALGLGLIVWAYRRPRTIPEKPAKDIPVRIVKEPSWALRIALITAIVFPLIIPSDWTQDVPERYGDRHAGLKHSALYPVIDGGAGE